jgi:hypothetical protein
MSDLHAVGVTAEFKEKLEGVHPRFLKQGMLYAREKSWEAYHAIKRELKEGMTEPEARKLALGVFADMGVVLKKHWHQPWVRMGEGTRLTFSQPMQPDYRLQPGDAVYMDLGPIFKDPETGIEYEGDVGDSFAFGENAEAEKCGAFARELYHEGLENWRQGWTGKQIYERIIARTREAGYEFRDSVVGHRVGDFPHQRYTKEELPRLEFNPSSHLWVLELQIVHPTLPVGAFFEDLLI